MADWQVAAISACAALLGAAVGGGMQLLLQARQDRTARVDSQRERKRARYSEFIHLVVQLPNLLYDATIVGESDGYQLIRREFVRRYDMVRAEMFLVASPSVQSGMKEVREAIQVAFDVWTEVSASDLERPRDDRLGVDVTLRNVFDAHVIPMLSELARLMATELEEV